MILSKRSLLIASCLGLFASLSFASGCSPDGNGDGDGDTGSTTGSGGATTGSGGANAGPSFCDAATTCPPDVSGVDLTIPVTFSGDVYPILIKSCSGGLSCHGANAGAGLNFGTAAAPLDEAGQDALVLQLISSDSQLVAVKQVVAKDWQNSFMMMKIDGCQNKMGLACTVPGDSLNSTVCYDSTVDPNNCGDGMPQVDPPTPNNPNTFPISDVERNTIRAWIAQGAMAD